MKISWRRSVYRKAYYWWKNPWGKKEKKKNWSKGNFCVSISSYSSLLSLFQYCGFFLKCHIFQTLLGSGFCVLRTASLCAFLNSLVWTFFSLDCRWVQGGVAFGEQFTVSKQLSIYNNFMYMSASFLHKPVSEWLWKYLSVLLKTVTKLKFRSENILQFPWQQLN